MNLEYDNPKLKELIEKHSDDYWNELATVGFAKTFCIQEVGFTVEFVNSAFDYLFEEVEKHEGITLNDFSILTREYAAALAYYFITNIHNYKITGQKSITIINNYYQIIDKPNSAKKFIMQCVVIPLVISFVTSAGTSLSTLIKDEIIKNITKFEVSKQESLIIREGLLENGKICLYSDSHKDSTFIEFDTELIDLTVLKEDEEWIQVLYSKRGNDDLYIGYVLKDK